MEEYLISVITDDNLNDEMMAETKKEKLPKQQCPGEKMTHDL